MKKKRLKYIKDQKYTWIWVWYHHFATISLLFSKSTLLPLTSIAVDTIFSFRFAVDQNERTNHSNRSSSHIWLFIIRWKCLSDQRKISIEQIFWIGNRIIWKNKGNRTRKKNNRTIEKKNICDFGYLEMKQAQKKWKTI